MNRHDNGDRTEESMSEGAVMRTVPAEGPEMAEDGCAVRGITAITDEILFYKSVGGQATIEIGKRLIEAKAQLRHGEWLPWLREKVEFSETSAQRFMQLAREYGNTTTVGDLGASKALVLLALPAAEREDFIRETHEVNGGEKTVAEMSKRELEEAVRQRKLAEAKTERAQRELEEERAGRAQAERAAQEAKERELAAQSEVEIAKSTALAAQERTAALEREMQEMRERPVDVAIETLDASGEQIAAAAAEARRAAAQEHAIELGKKAEELEEAREKLREAQLAAHEAEERNRTAREEAEQLRSELERAKRNGAAAQGKALAEFSILFRQTQESVQRMAELRNMLDAAEQSKITRALTALAKAIEAQAGEAEA